MPFDNDIEGSDPPLGKRKAGRPPKASLAFGGEGVPPVPSPSVKLALSVESTSSADDVDEVAATLDPVPLERRLGLRARLVIEECLREAGGWTKKERMDAALKTITTLEGSKERVWAQVTDGAPMEQGVYEKERRAVEARLAKLLGGPKATTKPSLVEKALEDIDKGIKGGEA